MKLFVKPRRASTVALIRDSSEQSGIEVLLMKRHLKDRFLPGYHVFPGGAVDERDTSQNAISDEYLNGMKFTSAEDRVNYFTHVICAIRETFEESGILLAESGTGYFSIDDIVTHDRFDSYRRMIFNGELDMMELIQRENLVPAFKNIHYLTRWITPPYSPIRYDTRFFVALAPETQRTLHDGDELISSEWLNPDAALQMYRKGGLKLVTPTVSTLEFLSGFNNVNEVIDHLVAEKVISPARSF
jgi:8-oxo-dGTP pyrophosphatase MutT (NUDIX family)